jgi:hypothetical protein
LGTTGRFGASDTTGTSDTTGDTVTGSSRLATMGAAGRTVDGLAKPAD